MVEPMTGPTFAPRTRDAIGDGAKTRWLSRLRVLLASCPLRARTSAQRVSIHPREREIERVIQREAAYAAATSRRSSRGRLLNIARQR
jgi:hypothetical protein